MNTIDAYRKAIQSLSLAELFREQNRLEAETDRADRVPQFASYAQNLRNRSSVVQQRCNEIYASGISAHEAAVRS